MQDLESVERNFKGDWERLQRHKRQERAKRNRGQLGQTANLGSKAQALTGRDEWDWMLRHMNTEMEIKAKQLAETQAMLVNPSSGLSDLEALALRQRGIRLQTELAVFEYLSKLPEKLIREGKEALKELKLVEA